MARTSTRISFGLYGLELRRFASPSTDEPLQPFAQIDDLRTGATTARPYASFEPDFWLLDGEYKFLPPHPYWTVHVGLMSQQMSDENGEFAEPIVLTVTFQGEPKTSDGLALIFSPYTGDYANSIKVQYYDDWPGGNLIRQDDYEPTSPEFSTGQPVEGFRRIVVTFYGTNRPHRYLRLTQINYGELISFESDSIKSCSAIEEINQLSTEVPFGTLDLGLISREAEFSILNPEGHYLALARRQPFSVYERVDGVEFLIGQYFLDEWENVSDTEYLFRAVDQLGVLDTEYLKEGLLLGTSAFFAVQNILGSIPIPFEMDVELLDALVQGWLPRGISRREALQQICFAIGASVTCARSGYLQIYRSKIASSAEAEQVITKAEKGLSQSLTLKPIVTRVEVTSHQYLPIGESDTIINEHYEPGYYSIYFDEPYHSLVAAGAIILDRTPGYAELQVVTAGTVTLTGLKYLDKKEVTVVDTPDVSPSTQPNVLKIEDATLVSPTNVAEVAQRVSDYYQQRYRQKVKLFAPSVATGDVVLVDTLYNKRIRAVIEKMEMNLSRGFVVEAEMTGVEHVD